MLKSAIVKQKKEQKMQTNNRKLKFLLTELVKEKRNLEDSESYLDVERDVLPIIEEMEQEVIIQEQKIVLNQYRNELGKALETIEVLEEQMKKLISEEKEQR